MKKIDINALARENVRTLKPYSSARDDFSGDASVFLDANENPFPAAYNRYPDPHQVALRRAISQLKGVAADQVFAGNGSDEVIDLLIRAFCEPARDQVVIPQPTYGMYSVCAEVNNVEVISPLLTENLDINVQSVLDKVTAKTKIIFLCSPNNPSGNLLNETLISEILNQFNGLVVIDEAYIDFAETAGWLPRLSQFRNLVVMQTFSKAWGLAGLRLGTCFADPSIISLLERIKPPYNVNAFTQAAVLEAIANSQDKKSSWVKEITQERERLKDKISAMPRVKHIFHSDANFLLVRVDRATELYQQLRAKGIIVRDRSNVIHCADCLRITVGTREENDLLLSTIQAL